MMNNAKQSATDDEAIANFREMVEGWKREMLTDDRSLLKPVDRAEALTLVTWLDAHIRKSAAAAMSEIMAGLMAEMERRKAGII